MYTYKGTEAVGNNKVIHLLLGLCIMCYYTAVQCTLFEDH